MTVLLDVFAEWFRSFGYTVARATPGDLDGPLMVERDARRVAVFGWLRREPVPDQNVRDWINFLKDARVDSGVLLCLGPVGDHLRSHLQPHGLHVWDTQRIIEELGEAVLCETLPDVWTRTDPFLPRKDSPILAAAQPAIVTAQEAPPPEPQAEGPFPVAAEPVLASEEQQPAARLEVPLAFGVLDQALAPAPAPPAPVVAAAPRPSKPILRTQVSRSLAVSMVKKKLRTIDRVFLRLSPYHIYDYEATLLVEGSLDAETKRGRMGVDASQKRILDWNLPLETGDVQADGADVDEKKVRVSDADAQNALRHELVKLVTRDVVMQEDDDEWSVVVKKKVNLGPSDVKLTPKGIYWVPVWRISGADGAVEIDASTGSVVFEEILSQRSDSQLI